MKILSYQNIYNNQNIKKHTNKKNINNIYQTDVLSISKKRKTNVSFGISQLKIEIPSFSFSQRVKELKKLGLSDYYAKDLAKLNSDRYKKAIELISLGVLEEGIEYATDLNEEEYKKALELVKHNINSEELASLARLQGNTFNRVIELKDKGIDTEQLQLFSELNDAEYEKAKELMSNRYTPVEAACLAKLSEEQKNIVANLLKIDTPIEIATEIAQMNQNKRSTCIKLIEKGISPEEAIHISNLDEEQQKRLNKIISLNIGDENITAFANFSEKQYNKAISLLAEGVIPEYISSIIAIEDGQRANNAYNEYRKKGYSRSISYALSLFDIDEKKELSKIIKKNPPIKKLLLQEYDLTLIELQDKNNTEAVFKRKIKCPNGTKITLVQKFDKKGNSIKSRTEEYSNNATSSIVPQMSDVYKTKYDKFGEIREITEFIQDPLTHAVTGVIHSKASTILPGVFESVYYDISKFKESDSSNGEVDYEIENCVNDSGTPISSVTKEEDGTIVFRENFNKNGTLTNRIYKERKNDNGEIIYSYYSYKIRDEKNKELMNTQREYKKNSDSSVTNIINGVEYQIEYDDKNKQITISDGKGIKKLSFKDKLAYYYQDILWETIKTLHVDTLLTIYKNIDRWNYCREKDSLADGYTKTISTGGNHSIILHEAGHFKDYKTQFSVNDEIFLKSYFEEMQEFSNSTPENEQEFIQYFSPKAEIFEAIGTNEFVAETNMILSQYGSNYENIKTRSQFLVRYFPKTIAIAADLLGKTSKNSLIEED